MSDFILRNIAKKLICALLCAAIGCEIGNAEASGRYGKPEAEVWPGTTASGMAEKDSAATELGRGLTLLDLVSIDSEIGADGLRFYRPMPLADIGLANQDFERPESRAALAEQFLAHAQRDGQRVRDLEERLRLAQRRGKSALTAALVTQQREYNQRIDDLLMGAARQYAPLLYSTRHKDYPAMDIALANMAIIMVYLRKTNNLDAVFERLQPDYPRSFYVDLGKMAMAELYSAQKDYQSALKIYRRIARNQNAKYAGYALYKSGRIYHALGDYQRALSAFAQAIEQAEGEP